VLAVHPLGDSTVPAFFQADAQLKVCEWTMWQLRTVIVVCLICLDCGFVVMVMVMVMVMVVMVMVMVMVVAVVVVHWFWHVLLPQTTSRPLANASLQQADQPRPLWYQQIQQLRA
jgi:hypothetical protein